LIRREADWAMSDGDSAEFKQRIISSENGIEIIESRLPHGAKPVASSASGIFLRIRFRYLVLVFKSIPLRIGRFF
tara:strand:- start:27362 stop:27586 length:225 start_codon:yes stop_codon:yes gene_type:complete